MDSTLIGTIITAVLALAGTSIGALAGIRIANKLVNYQLQELKEEVKKHNCLIDRMYKVEGRVLVLEKVQGIENKEE